MEKKPKGKKDIDKEPQTRKELKPKQKPKKKIYLWPLKVFFITLILALAFSVISEFAMTGANIVIAVLVLLFLITISIVFDVIGVAFASCDPGPINSMASRKIKGAKMSLKLLRGADKVSSICSDVIGDICGIISGACGAAISLRIISETEDYMFILIAIAVSALIAAVTVSGKALFKKAAFNNRERIVMTVGKVLSAFSKG